jgi:hypothetical protein
MRIQTGDLLAKVVDAMKKYIPFGKAIVAGIESVLDIFNLDLGRPMLKVENLEVKASETSPDPPHNPALPLPLPLPLPLGDPPPVTLPTS